MLTLPDYTDPRPMLADTPHLLLPLSLLRAFGPF
jgi:hypothetical protein